MSDFENQYNSGQAPIVPEQNQTEGNLSETTLRYLKETSPWLRFIGILGFISCGLMALIAILILAASSFLASLLSGWENIPIWLISIFYAAMGAVIFFPSRFTYNFGSKISKYQFSNSSEDLETAFKNNRALWKFYGILSIIGLAIIPLSFIASIVISFITFL